MAVKHILSEYVEQAMAQAVYDKRRMTPSADVSLRKGVVAFGTTLRECEDELRSVLEEWILLGLKLGNRLPMVGNIEWNSL
jgi:hypothetical protein